MPRRPIPGLLAAVALAFVGITPGAQESHRAAPSATTAAPGPLPTSAADRAAGAAGFAVHCAFCHGGRGEGGKGPTLALPALPRATDDAALVRIITTGLPGTEMPASRLSTSEIAQVAAFVRSLGELPPEPVRGDPANGARLFATKGACATCHTVHGRGGAFGPDLTTIGRRRSAGHLRRALVEPSADVPQSAIPYRSDVSLPENFLHVRVTTRDGREFAGVRLNEDAFSLQFRDASGRIHSVFKADLAALHKDRGYSPMPAYGDVFTAAELDDLVAHLVSLRGQP